MVFTFFFLLSCSHLALIPITLALLSPGVMLLNRSTAPRNSVTDIENTSRKGAPERERPNRSLVKMETFFAKICGIILLRNQKHTRQALVTDTPLL